MPETIKALYYGNIAPFEAPIPADSPLHKLTPKLTEYETTLAGLLDEENRHLIKDLTDIHEQISSITSEENFIQGFRLGMRLMAECLSKSQGGGPNG